MIASTVTACAACGARNRVPVSAPGKPRCGRCHSDLPWVVAAGDDDFAAAAQTSSLVLVDLWAQWCGPCRMVTPVLERLAAEYAGRLKVVKVDVDAAPGCSRRFQAMSIPTLVLMRDGVVVDRVVGAQPEAALRRWIEPHL